MDRLTPQGALKLLVQRSAPGAPEGATLPVRSAALGIWEEDLDTLELQWSADTFRIFGVDPATFRVTVDNIAAMVHPDDQAHVRAVFSRTPDVGEVQEVEYRIVRPDGAVRVLHERGEVTLDEHGRPTRKIGVVMDITDHRNAEVEARAAAEDLGRIVEVLQALSSDGQDLQAAMQIMAERAQQITGATGAVIELVEGDQLACKAGAGTCAGEVGTFLRIHASLSGLCVRERRTVVCDDTEDNPNTDLAAARRVQARSLVCAPLRDGERVIGVLKVMASQPGAFGAREQHSLEILVSSLGAVIQQHRQTEQLTRLNRAQKMLSALNEALVRAESEARLLREVCRIAVEIGGYLIAWVGYAQDDERKSIVPAAQRGSDDAYLHGLRMSWAADDPAGAGPIGRCVRSGEMVVIEDVHQDESFRPWLPRAIQKGYRGVRALPLRDQGRTFGVMNLYSAEALAVGPDEVELLLQMADNLAFGLATLRSRDERRRIQAAVMKVAAGVSAASGMAFFEQLAQSMAEAVGADLAFISRMLPGDAFQARSIALIVDGQVRPNTTYRLENTFTEVVLRDESRVVRGHLAEQFPGMVLDGAGVQAAVGQVLKSSSGVPLGVLCVEFRHPIEHVEFITSMLQIFAARAAAELERQEADMRIRDQASLLDKAQDAIIVRGVDDRVMYWNKSAERLYGWTSEEALGSPVSELVATDAQSTEHATEQVMAHGEWTGELTQRRKDGGTFSIEGRWTLIRDEFGAPQSIFEINTDITARKAAEREIQNLAFYDPLTKLPNRLLLLDRLQHALASSARTRRHGALLFIDLDNFKTLNDTLGHDQGDLLLREVALRLHGTVREADSLARLGGDEFVVMLEALAEERGDAVAQARQVAEKTLQALNQPYIFAGYQHHSTCSIGVTLFNDQPDNVNDLLKRADLAMYQAKAAGRNTIRFFDPEMQKLATARVILEADLRHGLKQHEFVLHYQPQVDAVGRIAGVEALVRWKHSRRGMVSPAEFIPFAEETGLILPLGAWVLESACQQLASWARHPATAGLYISVNVSARQFRHADFVPQVLDILARSGAQPRGLKLELTESLLLDNVEDIIAKMNALQAHGVSFALDDFGTGYSSLSYLKRLPLDQLKIDQSFVRDVLTDPNDAAIARTIVALAHSLGLSVLAEGVESSAQRDFLAAHACDAYQGYLFSKPLPIDQLEAFLAKAAA